MIDKVRVYLIETKGITDTRWTDWQILRFCRARKFKYSEIIKMIDKYLEWKTNVKMDELPNMDQSIVDRIKKNTSHGYCGTDKYGRPIFIDILRHLKPNEVFNELTSE